MLDPLTPKLVRTFDGYSLLSFPVLILALTAVKLYTGVFGVPGIAFLFVGAGGGGVG